MSCRSDIGRRRTELITRLGITPRENAISQGLKSRADKNIAKLRPLRGDAFDKEYIDFEIPFHEHMLEMIDNELMHNVKNKQLKGALIKTRPLFFTPTSRLFGCKAF